MTTEHLVVRTSTGISDFARSHGWSQRVGDGSPSYRFPIVTMTYLSPFSQCSACHGQTDGQTELVQQKAALCTKCIGRRKTVINSHQKDKLTVAGIPSPALAHFLRHCCRVSIPFCSMPFAMLAPRVTRPVGASTTAEHNTIRFDTIRQKSLPWTRKLSIQLNLAHVARN